MSFSHANMVLDITSQDIEKSRLSLLTGVPAISNYIPLNNAIPLQSHVSPSSSSLSSGAYPIPILPPMLPAADLSGSTEDEEDLPELIPVSKVISSTSSNQMIEIEIQSLVKTNEDLNNEKTNLKLKLTHVIQQNQEGENKAKILDQRIDNLKQQIKSIENAIEVKQSELTLAATEYKTLLAAIKTHQVLEQLKNLNEAETKLKALKQLKEDINSLQKQLPETKELIKNDELEREKIISSSLIVDQEIRALNHQIQELEIKINENDKNIKKSINNKLLAMEKELLTILEQPAVDLSIEESESAATILQSISKDCHHTSIQEQKQENNNDIADMEIDSEKQISVQAGTVSKQEIEHLKDLFKKAKKVCYNHLRRTKERIDASHGIPYMDKALNSALIELETVISKLTDLEFLELYENCIKKIVDLLEGEKLLSTLLKSFSHKLYRHFENFISRAAIDNKITLASYGYELLFNTINLEPQSIQELEQGKNLEREIKSKLDNLMIELETSDVATSDKLSWKKDIEDMLKLHNDAAYFKFNADIMYNYCVTACNQLGVELDDDLELLKNVEIGSEKLQTLNDIIGHLKQSTDYYKACGQEEDVQIVADYQTKLEALSHYKNQSHNAASSSVTVAPATSTSISTMDTSNANMLFSNKRKLSYNSDNKATKKTKPTPLK